jgi:hypothetical protein
LDPVAVFTFASASAVAGPAMNAVIMQSETGNHPHPQRRPFSTALMSIPACS